MFWNKPKPVQRPENPYRVPTFDAQPKAPGMTKDTKAGIVISIHVLALVGGVIGLKFKYPAPTIAHLHMVAARAAGVTTQRVHGYQPTSVYCYGEPSSCSLHDGVRCLVSWPGATRRQTWCCDTHEGHENRGCLNVN